MRIQMKASDIVSGNLFLPHCETPADRFCILKNAFSDERKSPRTGLTGLNGAPVSLHLEN